MNGGIVLTFLLSAWTWFYNILSDSKFWKLLTKIHLAFRKAFENSRIINFIKHDYNTGSYKNGIMCRIFKIPMFAVSYVCDKIHLLIKSFVVNSYISKVAGGYLSGFLSLDISFFGVIMLFSGVTAFLFNIFSGSINKYYIILAGAGLLLTFVRVKLADFLDGSAVVKFVKTSLGFQDYSFKVYKNQRYAKLVVSGALIGCVAGVLAAIKPMLILFPFAMFGMLVILAYPLCGVFISVFLAPIMPTMVVVASCFYTTICSLLNKAYKKQYALKVSGVGICYLIFLFVLLISTILSFGRGGSIGVFGMYLIFITFFFTIINEVKSTEVLSNIFRIFVISAAVVSIYGIMQYAFGWTTKNAWIDTDMFEDATMRVYSTLANPNVLGEYLILALPIAAVVFLEYAKSVWERIVYIGMFGLILLCLILTQSRGCWIGFFVSAIIFVTYYKSELWKILPIFILIIPFFLPETIVNRMLSVGNMSDSSTSYRVYIWLGTLLMLKDFWLCGIGPGETAFRNIYPYYSYSGIVAPHSHNLYLQLTVESGICGLIVFAASVLVFLKGMINVQARGRKYGVAGNAIMSAAIAFLVQSMFDYTFYNYRVMGIFFMVVAFGVVLMSISRKEVKQLEKNN